MPVSSSDHCPRPSVSPKVMGLWLPAMLLATALPAQELEPRALQNAPVGANVVLGAIGYSRGNLLMDPALPIENARADVWSLTTGFVRAIGLFGLSGKLGFIVPFATGSWKGTVAGADTSASRTGLGDPRVQLSVNFLGAPALTQSQMRSYRAKTVVGVQLRASVPVGQYYPERLVNLGTNRWSFRPRLGVSQAVGSRLTLEGYSAVTFFTTNHNFYGGQVLTQAPFLEIEGDAIYTIRNPDIWIAGSLGYGWGGATTLNGVPAESHKNARASVVLRLPLARGHALKLIYVNGLTTRLGADFDTYQIAYQYAFGGRR